MPKHSRPGIERVELSVPAALLTEIWAAAEAVGEPLNTFVIKAAAKRAGVKYTPPRRGRPRKP